MRQINAAAPAAEAAIYAKYTEALAGELARETAASADEIEPWIVAHALVGLHQTVVDYHAA